MHVRNLQENIILDVNFWLSLQWCQITPTINVNLS